MDVKPVDEICKEHSDKPEHLIGVLHDIQAHYRYLPKNALEVVSKRLDVPIARIYAVATFFKAFSLKPRGENIINVCMGTACHVRGAKQVVDEMERSLGISAGETTKDGKVTLETVNCLGCCAMGPVAVVNGEYHGEMDASKARKLISEIKESK